MKYAVMLIALSVSSLSAAFFYYRQASSDALSSQPPDELAAYMDTLHTRLDQQPK